MKKYSRVVGIGTLVLVAVALTACSSKNASTTTTTAAAAASTTAPRVATTTHPAPTTTAPAGRKVQGTATTLGAGTFKGGTDVPVGLYDVTTAAGQSGNFTVGTTYNEILGGDGSGGGVPSIRVQISSGDQIQISSLSTVVFTPVTTPYVTAHATINLGAGTWVVGKDIGSGRYVATPGAGQSGNFTVGTTTNEILGTDTSTGDVPSVAVTLNNGERNPDFEHESGNNDGAVMAEMVKCPWCAEEILAEAKKCKHCGEFLTHDHPVAITDEAPLADDDETPEVEGQSGWKKAQDLANTGRRKKLSAAGERTDHGLACPKCGGTQFTAKRSKMGKTIGFVDIGRWRSGGPQIASEVCGLRNDVQAGLR